MRTATKPKDPDRSARSHRSLVMAIAVAFAATFVPTPAASTPPKRGTLGVRVKGFENDDGQLVAKLFRRGDDVPKGRSYRLAKVRIKGRNAKVTFKDVPYGTYALFVFHDENSNDTVDHNFLGMPTEALGFSNGYQVTLFSGVPDFDDLKFSFTPKTGVVALTVD